MRIKSDKGVTEVHFKDFVAVNAAVEQVRAGYRKACIEKPGDRDKHREKVRTWTARNFGQNTYMADFDRVTGAGVGGPLAALRVWDEWIAANPSRIKAHYDPWIVAECIMGEDE